MAGLSETRMAPGRLAGFLQAAEEVHTETMRDMLLALLSFTPEFDGAVLTTETVSKSVFLLCC